jgi:hypothetical protein
VWEVANVSDVLFYDVGDTIIANTVNVASEVTESIEDF